MNKGSELDRGGQSPPSEPWRPYEGRVGPEGALTPVERARRSKIAYRAHMRALARRSVMARAAVRSRKESARRRRLARPLTEVEMARFRRERDAAMAVQIIWAAAQRGERGLAGLRRRQLEVREDCLLCHRPFSDADRGSVRLSALEKPSDGSRDLLR